MEIYNVLYAQVTVSALDEISQEMNTTMQGDGQLLIDIETLENCIEYEVSAKTHAEIDTVLNYAEAVKFGGDVILHK
ncbi:MAG: hypothetical protein D4S01_11490 [Dehalococcoidia bacterium]|nr:MAG: hypothetical protein D4S01_11490 [Dehalococcoidia bacterium]